MESKDSKDSKGGSFEFDVNVEPGGDFEELELLNEEERGDPTFAQINSGDKKAKTGGYLASEINKYITSNFDNTQNIRVSKVYNDSGNEPLSKFVATEKANDPDKNEFVATEKANNPDKNEMLLVPIGQMQNSKLFGKYDSIFGWQPKFLFKPRKHFTLLQLKLNRSGDIISATHTDSKTKGWIMRYDLKPLEESIRSISRIKDNAAKSLDNSQNIEGEVENVAAHADAREDLKFETKYTGKQKVLDTTSCGIHVLTKIQCILNSEDSPKDYNRIFTYIKERLNEPLEVPTVTRESSLKNAKNTLTPSITPKTQKKQKKQVQQ